MSGGEGNAGSGANSAAAAAVAAAAAAVAAAAAAVAAAAATVSAVSATVTSTPTTTTATATDDALSVSASSQTDSDYCIPRPESTAEGPDVPAKHEDDMAEGKVEAVEEPKRMVEAKGDDLVTLVADGCAFEETRRLLSESCDYFAAMFGGHYREADQDTVQLQMISSKAMETILYFFKFKTVKLLELEHAEDLLHAVNYLNLTELYNLILDMLISRIDSDTCFIILHISKVFNLRDLESKVKSYALYSFKEVKKHMKTIEDDKTLLWYLSHEHLNVADEIDVFEAGCEWMRYRSTRSDDVLIILSCIIFDNLKASSFTKILNNEFVKNNEKALSFVNAVIEKFNVRSESLQPAYEPDSYESGIQNMLDSLPSMKKIRIPALDPCVLKRTRETFEVMTLDDENTLKSRLSICGTWWGNCVVSWKGFMLIVLGGKSREDDLWNDSIRIFNFLEDKWITIPSTSKIMRRHSTAIVNDDIIYLIGGFGQYRIQLCSVQTYNIVTNVWSSLTDLPETNSCIVGTFHQGQLYVAASHLYVYQYDEWDCLFKLPDSYSSIISYNDRLYFTERWKNKLLCWKDQNFFVQRLTTPELVKNCHYNVVGICNIANVAYIFSEGDDLNYSMSVESYSMTEDRAKRNLNTSLIWLDREPSGNFYTVTGCFTLAKLHVEDKFISNCGEQWLSKPT